MNFDELFFRIDPVAPWAGGTFGLPLLGLAMAAMVLLTLWSYRGHRNVSRRRIAIVLTLRLTALVILFLSTVRPTVGIQEKPKVPSVLLIGVDCSESMTIPDELNNQTRIDAVRKVLERCEPTLNALRTEQNVEVVFHAFGGSNFQPASSAYDATTSANLPQSDYAHYLGKMLEVRGNEPYLRAHIIIGDGTDNGPQRPEAEAAKWRQAGKSIHTFAVGSATTDSGTKDVALIGLNAVSGSADGSVFIKTDVTFRVVANAFGFVGSRVPVKLWFDENDGKGYVLKQTDTALLAKETDNVIDIKAKAPDRPGEIKVKVEVPVEAVPGDVAPSNNIIETYVNVSKEGMRVLIINRLSFEHAMIRRALVSDNRIDLFPVIRQTDEPARPEERLGLDFTTAAYDVIVIGNVSARQLTTLDPGLPAAIRDQVRNKGVGLLFTGGHAAFLGTDDRRFPDAKGWLEAPEILDILPVDLRKPMPIPEAIFTSDRARIQYLPTARQQDHYLNRLGESTKQSLEFWNKLNDASNRARFTGLSKMGTPKPLATLFAVASDAAGGEPIPVPPGAEGRFAPLLVGHQIGVGGRGRVLAFGAMDTLMWQTLGRPNTADGAELHGRFWRQMIRWLANQEDESSQVFARPELPRLPVGGRQTIRIGIRRPGGTPALEPRFTVKVIAPGETEATAALLPYVPDSDGQFKVLYEPRVPGEYAVKVTGLGKDEKGVEFSGEAVARFYSFPTASDEMAIKAAKPEVLQRTATSGGGTFHRLEDLPRFLDELAAKPLEIAKPRPKFYPDWRRESGGAFLPTWLVLLVVVLGCEWGLRRFWGLI